MIWFKIEGVDAYGRPNNRKPRMWDVMRHTETASPPRFELDHVARCATREAAIAAIRLLQGETK